MRLCFMGTPDFAVPALDALLAAGHEVAAVYCQPSRPAGRGQAMRDCPVRRRADALGLPVRSPISFRRDPEAVAAFAALAVDVAVVAAYGLILPGAVLDAPRIGCLNIHASLLPRWRGAAPIQAAILAGDRETGITIMRMEAGLDTGAMLLREAAPIGSGTDAAALHDTLAAIGARLAARALALPNLAAALAAAEPQDGSQATHAPKLSREDGAIDWRMHATILDRRIRAMNPWPGAYTRHAGQMLKIRRATPIPLPPTPLAPPGTVLDDAEGLAVVCGDGVLRLSVLQREGRAAMPARELLRGWPIPPGTVLI